MQDLTQVILSFEGYKNFYTKRGLYHNIKSQIETIIFSMLLKSATNVLEFMMNFEKSSLDLETTNIS